MLGRLKEHFSEKWSFLQKRTKSRKGRGLQRVPINKDFSENKANKRPSLPPLRRTAHWPHWSKCWLYPKVLVAGLQFQLCTQEWAGGGVGDSTEVATNGLPQWIWSPGGSRSWAGALCWRWAQTQGPLAHKSCALMPQQGLNESAFN